MSPYASAPRSDHHSPACAKGFRPRSVCDGRRPGRWITGGKGLFASFVNRGPGSSRPDPRLFVCGGPGNGSG
jgi:hypothetical protein